jgi:diadenylate cyclase
LPLNDVKGGKIVTLDDIVSLVRKLLDVLIVWMVLYYILKNLRKNVKMVLLFKGILVILLLAIISDVFSLSTIGFLLNNIIMWGPIALIIIFQPEIRNVLEQLGRSQLLGRHKVLTVDEREKVVYEIMQAIDYLKRSRIGALIVIERDNSLSDYIERSKKIYADVSSELLIDLPFLLGLYEGLSRTTRRKDPLDVVHFGYGVELV